LSTGVRCRIDCCVPATRCRTAGRRSGADTRAVFAGGADIECDAGKVWTRGYSAVPPADLA
jgi:hypothetical protein